MSGAPIMSGSTKFARPANTGMMNRKMRIDAWTENSPLNASVRHELHPGLRQLGAHQHGQRAAHEQEEERGDRVLDADHLVVGVHAEVVLPRARAVARVVLGHRGSAGGPAEPVVEGPDADEEEQRRGEERDDGHGVAVEHRVEPVQRAHRQHDGVGEPDRRAAMPRPPRSKPGARSLAIIWLQPLPTHAACSLAPPCATSTTRILPREDVHGLAHRGVSQAAQLRAHHRIACPDGSG